MVEAMNLMGYNAMALRASDLELAEDVLGKHKAQAHFPWLSANVVPPAVHEDRREPRFVNPYVLLDVDGHQVGIVGLTDSSTLKTVGNVVVPDPTTALSQYMPELQAQTNIVIVLSGLDGAANKALAEAVPGLDLIIGSGGLEVTTERWQSPQTGTLVWQLGVYAREHPGWPVTLINVTLDGAGRLTEFSGTYTELAPEIADDPEIRSLLDSYRVR
jgi:2',3'-cyclic-nucleotide 2'-phosphodiesterase (5'-nucleotidase family)